MRVRLRGDAYDLDTSLLAESDDEVRRQLDQYAAGERQAFDLTVDYPAGHLGDVMRAMAAIPYGETRRYGDIAARMGSGAVAVGQACGANPLPVVVPCHRVVGADGTGGFSAPGGVDAKRRLLAFERGEGLDRF
ncbi:hypothetical protein JCM30237_15530 [Halolamina litorea]|uniref:Methylated-DNA--[protein]-cysteine S-methyltransferase n=1 Tax=Halolamina litorea TaxID=1515593 RepID=A0ABD6BMV6_9EURY|nr:methylated-DNA--[protein]-cysteine S-methyltransferase [Halolamina litorea]